jgi:hypothetical protein
MMRKSISVLVLALVLSLTGSASAGDMQNGVNGTPPPPPPAPAVQEPTADDETPDILTTVIVEVVLNLLALP